jgi:hypothetical protein
MTTSARLCKDRLVRLHDIMARHVRRGAAPGLVSVVSRRGEAEVDAIGVTGVTGRRGLSDPAAPGPPCR